MEAGESGRKRRQRKKILMESDILSRFDPPIITMFFQIIKYLMIFMDIIYFIGILFNICPKIKKMRVNKIISHQFSIPYSILIIFIVYNYILLCL